MHQGSAHRQHQARAVTSAREMGGRVWVREVYKLKADGSSSRKMSHSLSDLLSLRLRSKEV